MFAIFSAFHDQNHQNISKSEQNSGSPSFEETNFRMGHCNFHPPVGPMQLPTVVRCSLKPKTETSIFLEHFVCFFKTATSGFTFFFFQNPICLLHLLDDQRVLKGKPGSQARGWNDPEKKKKKQQPFGRCFGSIWSSLKKMKQITPTFFD